MWNTGVQSSAIRSVDAQFARVSLQGPNSLTEVGTPIGLPWDEPGAPIVYSFESNAMLEQNCVTLLAAKGQGGFDFSFLAGGLDSNLRAAIDSQSTLTAYFYRGTMISPVAAAIGDDRVRVLPGAVSRFGVLTSIWSWYRNNPEMIRHGDQGSLSVLRDFEGVAAYRIQGLTQRRLMQAQASANVSFLVFRASGEGSYEQARDFRANQNDFSIAYWNPTRLVLPSAATVAQQVSWFAPERISRVAGDVTPIENNSSFTVAWDVSDMTPAICRADFWRPEVQPNRVANQALLLSVTVAPGEGGKCRFTARFTPPTTSSNQVQVALNARAAMPNAATADLVLASEAAEIPDYRAATGIDNPTGAPTGMFAVGGSGAAVRLPVTYEIRELQPGRRVTAATWDGRPSVTCAGAPARAIAQPALPVIRVGDSATLAATYDLPAELVANAPAGTQVACQVTGRVRLTVNSGQAQPVVADLPSHPFMAVVAATAQPPR